MKLLGNTLIHGVEIVDKVSKSKDFINIPIREMKRLLDSSEFNLYLKTSRGNSPLSSSVLIKSIDEELYDGEIPIYKITDAISDRLTKNSHIDFSVYSSKDTKFLIKGMPISADKIINSDFLVTEEFSMNNPTLYSIKVDSDKSGLLCTNIVINNITIKL